MDTDDVQSVPATKSATTNEEKKPPSPPKIRTTSSTEKSITLSWSASEPSQDPITKYVVEYKEKGSSDNWQTEEVGANTLKATIEKDINPDTEYQVRVKAVDNGGLESGYSEAEITTSFPFRSSLLKQTGQTKSYNTSGNEVTNNSLKDDGYYRSGLAPSYKRTNDIVTDNVTGLEWQDDVAVKNNKRSFSDAKSYCQALPLEGKGWRLPTLNELKSIIDYSNYESAINAEFQNRYTGGGAGSTGYWATTPNNKIWGMFSYSGFSYPFTTQEANGKKFLIRCVRGNSKVYGNNDKSRFNRDKKTKKNCHRYSD